MLFGPEKEGCTNTGYNMMNLESTVLSERSQTQKATLCMVLFIKNIQNKQVVETERLVAVRGQRKRTGSDC